MTNLPDSLFTKEGNRFVKNWRTLLFIKIAPLFCKEGLGRFKTMSKGQKMKRTFHDNLILNRYLLSLFNQDNLEKFKQRLGDDRFEGIDNDGQTKFFHELTGGQLFQTDLISENDLRRYDLNIVKHWQQITEHRNKVEGHILKLKYFQYLSLLFTEIYLDFYFNRPNELLNQLNEQLVLLKENDNAFPDFDLYEFSDLNKLAFWNATGSGKTLLMHVNILQYQHYQKNKDLTVFVITPNEGLSQQHLAEFTASSLPASLFDKNKPFQGTGLFNDIQIMDINKLADKDGELTVAVDRFLDLNKLVLVDEGHRGSSGDQWFARRQKLIGDGFAFEYSATFGQAVKDGKTVKDCLFDIQKKIGKENGITKKAEVQKIPTSFTDKQEAKQKAVFETYAKCVLFDYSYKFFYADGYGKEFSILNMKAEDYGVADNDRKYFVASLLSFYQQLYLFTKNQEKLTAYNLHKPLWVFVGNTVNAENSDIWAVVEQLAYFLDGKNRSQILAWLNDLLCDEPLLLDSKGNAIFRHRFLSLATFKGNLNALYSDILKTLFNAESASHLYLHNIKKASGEVALKVGNNDYFALINVGDSSELLKNAVELENVSVEQDEFSDGLFGSINKDSSTLNLLIGSRKFTEGWSSWRVSTMGLLNMGRGEGSQIIQLFGRGIRLKGRNFSLRRTPINEMPKGLGLDKLETLNIFGIKADYMAKFREYLQDEGIQSPDEVLQLDFPVQKRLPANVALKTLRLKDGYKDNQKMGFKRQEMVQLYELPKFAQGKIKPILAVLDLYPRLEALSSKAIRQSDNDERQSNKFKREIFALFDWDKLYLELQQYKMERTWSNLRVSRDGLRKFVESRDDWYLLYVPDSAMEIRCFADVQTQQDILLQLLKEYTDQFYRRLKAAYEQQFMETMIVTEENGSFFDEYKMLFGEEENIPYEREQTVKKIEELADLIRDKKIEQAMNWQSPLAEFKAVCFNSHLFYPLISFDKSTGLPIKISPLPFDAESEVKFIHDLMIAEESGLAKLAKWLDGKSLYLMRNADRKDKGLGFALAGNFYPDFLLWVVDYENGKQWLNFVDPKSITRMDLDDQKLGLYKVVKEYEAQIADPNLVLNSFIVSINKLESWKNIKLTAEELADRHILFFENNYLQQMFEKMQ